MCLSFFAENRFACQRCCGESTSDDTVGEPLNDVPQWSSTSQLSLWTPEPWTGLRGHGAVKKRPPEHTAEVVLAVAAQGDGVVARLQLVRQIHVPLVAIIV